MLTNEVFCVGEQEPAGARLWKRDAMREEREKGFTLPVIVYERSVLNL